MGKTTTLIAESEGLITWHMNITVSNQSPARLICDTGTYGRVRQSHIRSPHTSLSYTVA
jgi:hypothetical protein